MARRPHTAQYTATGEVVWPVGRVAEMLGVPTVTIRSWERRYGIGPSLRSSGQHRRYSAEDVARLRQMIALIAGGTPPADAARLSAPPGKRESEPDALLASAEAYQVAAMAEILDSSIESRGIHRAWNELVVPAMHELEQRFADEGDCIDLTVLLAGAVDEAIERYLVRRGLQHNGTPCLLVFCPDEHHTLPLKALRAVLLERGIAVIALDPGGNDAAILAAADRAQPAVVVLWATIRRSGQAALRRRLEQRGHRALTAGPGWPQPDRDLGDLDAAVAQVVAACREPHRVRA